MMIHHHDAPPAPIINSLHSIQMLLPHPMMALTYVLIILAAHPLLDPLTTSTTAIFTLMKVHQIHGSPPVALILLLQEVLSINNCLHTAFIWYCSRVLIIIAMSVVDLAGPHPYLSNYLAKLSTSDTCISIFMKG